MSNLSLARKYRPTDFEHVVGQPHISTLLKKAINNGKISHSYLFTGTRGVGKTTMARLLSLRLNCMSPVDGNPCMKCDSCVDILSGNSLDVREIDGASNNGVDDIRSLRESVEYSPTFGSYKIIIIDEVHMLSNSAFNALLKTLEEPPAHVIFIFATTEPHKIPDTILSRCQRYDFKRISDLDLVDRFKFILEKEGVIAEEEALYLIAKKANGSMRDGLSLLDQIVSFSENNITYKLVVEFLGVLGDEILLDILHSLKFQDFNELLEIVEKLNNSGVDFEDLVSLLIEMTRNLLVAKTADKYWNSNHKFSEDKRNLISEKSKVFTKRELLRLLNIFNTSVSDFKYSTDLRMSLEVILYKATLVFDTIELKDIDKNRLVDDSASNLDNNFNIEDSKKKTLIKDNTLNEKTTYEPTNNSVVDYFNNNNVNSYSDSTASKQETDLVSKKENKYSVIGSSVEDKKAISFDEIRKTLQANKDVYANLNIIKDGDIYIIEVEYPTDLILNVLQKLEKESLQLLREKFGNYLKFNFVYKENSSAGFKSVDKNDPHIILEEEREKYPLIDQLLSQNIVKLQEIKRK